MSFYDDDLAAQELIAVELTDDNFTVMVKEYRSMVGLSLREAAQVVASVARKKGTIVPEYCQ